MKAKSILIFAIVVLAIVGAYFGLSSLSTTGTGKITLGVLPSSDIDIPYTCMMPQDCVDKMLSDGAATDASYNTFVESYDIKCLSNKCVGVKK